MLKISNTVTDVAKQYKMISSVYVPCYLVIDLVASCDTVIQCNGA